MNQMFLHACMTSQQDCTALQFTKKGGRKAIKGPLDVRIEDYTKHMKFFVLLCPDALRSWLGNSVRGHPLPEVTST